MFFSFITTPNLGLNDEEKTYQNGSSRQHSGSHGGERNLVGGTVSSNGVELRPIKVDASNDEVGANVTLVSVKKQVKFFSLVACNNTKYLSHNIF